MRVAVDVTGLGSATGPGRSDEAVKARLGAAVRSLLQAEDGLRLCLVGSLDPDAAVATDPSRDPRVYSRVASALAEGEQPLVALRGCPDAGPRVAARMVRDGEAEAAVIVAGLDTATAAGTVGAALLPGSPAPVPCWSLAGPERRTLLVAPGGAAERGATPSPAALALATATAAVVSVALHGHERPRIGVLGAPGTGGAELVAGAGPEVVVTTPPVAAVLTAAMTALGRPAGPALLLGVAAVIVALDPVAGDLGAGVALAVAAVRAGVVEAQRAALAAMMASRRHAAGLDRARP